MKRGELMRRVRAGVGLAVAVGVSCLAPTAASAVNNTDLEVTTKVIASSGNDHTVRITLTNNGPERAVGNPEGYEEGDIPYGFSISYVPIKSTVIKEGAGCSPEGNGFRRCETYDSLAVGESRSVDVRVRATDPDSALQANYRAVTSGFFSDPDPSNDYATRRFSTANSSLTLFIGKRGDRIDATGALRPAHPGKKVLVELTRNGRAFGKTNARVASNSAYAATFKRPRSGTCKVKVTFAGDSDHSPSSKKKRFSC
jgi:hypothetical protein